MASKGRRDCGAHEWYRQDDRFDVCYHCVVGKRAHQPIDVPIDIELRGDLAAAAAHGSTSAAAALERLEVEDRMLSRDSPPVRS